MNDAVYAILGLPIQEPVHAVVLIPMLAAAVLTLVSEYRLAAMGNILASLLTLGAAVSLLFQPFTTGSYLLVDDLNVFFILLNAVVGFSTSLFSAPYIAHELESGHLTLKFVRFYHPMFQAMMGAMNLALAANNLGLLWVGLELATLITVVLVGIYRSPAALEASWKYFILSSVGISLAFFGTILVYLAGQDAVGSGYPAMTWTTLLAAAPRLDAALLDLAFAFLLIGFGTKVGLAPLHAWLPDAHAEGPTPVSAVLSGLLLNVALFALLRYKALLVANPHAIKPGAVLIVMGLMSLLFAAFMLYRCRDIKRLFAYSSIEHMGIITFAFGLGGPLANFAGLLHMLMHSLTKSAIFYAVGHVSQAKGTLRLSDIRGLSATHPALALGLSAGVLAIAGLPPFGTFMSEFIMLTNAFAREPWLALIFAAGLLIAFGALLMALQNIIMGAATEPAHKVHGSLIPLAIHLGLVFVGGMFLPVALQTSFQRAAELLG